MTETIPNCIVQTLEKAGVDQFSGITGESLDPLNDRLRRSGSIN